jgi:hypothetical protein
VVGFDAERRVDPLVHVPQAPLPLPLPLAGGLARAANSSIFGVVRHRRDRHGGGWIAKRGDDALRGEYMEVGARYTCELV